jgi:hypothetical protein
MSHPNKILDPDAAIRHIDDPTQSANAPPNRHQFQPPPPPPPPPPPTLPTGQIIDGKNTLQSFDTFVCNDVAAITTNATTGEDEAEATRAATLATTHDTTHPITATTDTAATTHPPDPQLYTLHKKSVTPPTNLGTENVIIRNSINPSDTAVPVHFTTNNTDQDNGSGNNNTNSGPTVHAFVVESQIVVDAEPISVLLQPQPEPQPPLQQQRSPVFYIAITLVSFLGCICIIGCILWNREL